MDDLFPNYLFGYINPNKIDLGDYEQNGVGCTFPNMWIFINSTDSLEEQVQSMLHEICHFNPRFVTYTGALFEESTSRCERIEREIEAHAQRVYRERPDVVGYVKRVLKEKR